jgi:predicted AAA+ superfamily ATPase
LFSYIQVYADESGETGKYILSGSQNFLLMQKITQSLAGRVALFVLLPFSLQELKDGGISFEKFQEYIIKGSYPRIYDYGLQASDWYPNYISTYIERDVRQISNIGDLAQFRMFMKMCAGAVGQMVNFSSIGNSIGVSYNTIKHWLSILESSYVVFLLSPYFKNIQRRTVKSPKIYFHDTGLLCELLGIHNTDQLDYHYAKGAIFENLVISELIKNKFNKKGKENFYFYRDSHGNEIDCLIEKSDKLTPIEVKAAQTINSDFFKVLNKTEQIFSSHVLKKYVIYGGYERQIRSDSEVYSWEELINPDRFEF